MRRYWKFWIILYTLTLFQILVCVAPTWGLDGNPHDFFIQGYLQTPLKNVQLNPQCIECHTSQSDSRPLIWDVVPESIKNYGKVGNLCASCHDGVSMVDRNVDAGMTVFHPQSHGNDSENAPEDTFLENTGLLLNSDNSMTCITCHDPHLPKHRPFLSASFEGICERCHPGWRRDRSESSPSTGFHPVGVEPFDNTGGASPVEVKGEFRVPFPQGFPAENAYLSEEGHWTLGGHLTFGSYGRVECFTCHAFHGVEKIGPFEDLLAKDPVKAVSNEFCEGCHQGVRGDGKEEPPYPNPGGTVTGRTYHPVDDDEANGVGWIVAIADTTDRSHYEWGEKDPDTDLPAILCTTCHVAHNGMENSPGLVSIADSTREQGVTTFCEICHRYPPEGHHGYADTNIFADSNPEKFASTIRNLGTTYGEIIYEGPYCSYCHRAHNAGYGGIETDFIPILVDSSSEICLNCHLLGVSHFMGDPTLASTFGLSEPALYREVWPATDLPSKYEGSGENPNKVSCLSCHYLSAPGSNGADVENRLLAPAGEEDSWDPGYPEDYLCTGCHGESPATVGEGKTHPLVEADGLKYPVKSMQLDSDETSASYTLDSNINCHSCHRAHWAALEGGVYILKMVDGSNTNALAIHPQIMYTKMCYSCHDN